MKNTDKLFVFLTKNNGKPLRLIDKAGKVLEEGELIPTLANEKGIVNWILRVPTKEAVAGVYAKDKPLTDQQCEQIKDEGKYLSLVIP